MLAWILNLGFGGSAAEAPPELVVPDISKRYQFRVSGESALTVVEKNPRSFVVLPNRDRYRD